MKFTCQEGNVKLQREVWAFEEVHPVFGDACGLASLIVVLSHHLEECGLVSYAERATYTTQQLHSLADFGEKHQSFFFEIY